MTWLDVQEANHPAKVAAALQQYVEQRGMLRAAAHDGGDMRFGLWLALTDRQVSRLAGVGLFDLTDWPSRDAYEDGQSPREAARLALSLDDTYAAMFAED